MLETVWLNIGTPDGETIDADGNLTVDYAWETVAGSIERFGGDEETHVAELRTVTFANGIAYAMVPRDTAVNRGSLVVAAGSRTGCDGTWEVTAVQVNRIRIRLTLAQHSFAVDA